MQHSPAQFLTFTIAGQRFAVRTDDVVEIVRAVRLARLPKAPPVIEGVIDLRGRVVPVLDVRTRFRLASKGLQPSDHFIIARANARVIGIRVDRAVDVLTLSESDVAEIGTVAPTSEYVAGVAKLTDGLVLIHDLATFLSHAEAQELAALVEEGVAA
jgi:purine-binding chemotaxis protein CheW